MLKGVDYHSTTHFGEQPDSDLALAQALVMTGFITRERYEQVVPLARRWHTPVTRALLSQSQYHRPDFYTHLSKLLNIPLVSLSEIKLNIELLHQFEIQFLARHCFLPIHQTSDQILIAMAFPDDLALIRHLKEQFQTSIHVVLCTDMDVLQQLAGLRQKGFLDHAIDYIKQETPLFSARQTFLPSQLIVFFILYTSLLISLYLKPGLTLIILNILINLFFVSCVLFKFLLTIIGSTTDPQTRVTREEVADLDESTLPIYTILVPVYKEPDVLPSLIQHLTHLDYPKDKLDIKILLEEDDLETIQTFESIPHPHCFHAVVVPPRGPRTKPKACSFGLHFARGEYVTIYDAEDNPEPDQLKKAILAFRKSPPNIICLQAALNYFNCTENTLTRMFTLEYSYWFDCMLPGLEVLKVPIPLGGTSNHFITERLRKLGGWDPYNVTEDADLGVRASMVNLEVGTLNSTTWEEANCSYRSWINQRSRWIKGYMQTYFVHMRRPLEFFKSWEGVRTFIGLHLFIAGTPMTFLTTPLMWGMFAYWILTRSEYIDPLFPHWVLYISLFNLLIGNFLAVYMCLLSGFRRGLWSTVPYSLLNPLYWQLHSIAAYKALWQLLTNPFYWEKTTHGMTSHKSIPMSSPPRTTI